MTDVFERELVPGDYVIMHGSGGFYIGVFVKETGRNYHVQCHYFWNFSEEDITERLARAQRDLESAQMGRSFRMNPVCWTNVRRRLMKVDSGTLPPRVVELLDITRQLLIFKRKIR